MACTRRSFVGAAATAMAAALTACGKEQPAPAPSKPADNSAAPAVDTSAYKGLLLNMDAWRYDKDHDVYYQLGVPYCTDPVAEAYEKLSVFVPGAYFTGEEHGDAYHCELNVEGTVGAFTAKTAPVIFPVNCPDYAAQMASTTYSYEGLRPYLEAGCVYAFAGCRGRADGYDPNSAGDGFFPGGMPWNLVDLKAALRFLHLNALTLPGEASRPVALGLGAGGNLASLLGTTGDAHFFDPYLDKIGAARWNTKGQTLTDALGAVVVWCPQTGLASMDGAYEWLYGQYASDGARAKGVWTRELSHDLAIKWAEKLNALGLQTPEGEALTLDKTNGALYADGPFYGALLGQVQDAAERFFEVTSFPATITSQDVTSAVFPGGQTDSANAAELAAGAQQAAEVAAGEGVAVSNPSAGVAPAPKPVSASYDTAESYVESLNARGSWITYAPGTSRVRVSSLEGYAKACAPATLPCPAFDGLACKTPQNQVFGVRGDTTLHYNENVWDLLNGNMFEYSKLKEWDSVYVGDWGVDLRVRNSMEDTVEERVAATDQFDYVCPEGHFADKGSVAPFWRVNVGLGQSRSPLSAAYALVCALRTCDRVSAVEFNAVWGRGHELCEVTGDAVANMLSWVTGTVPKPSAQDKTSDGDAQ